MISTTNQRACLSRGNSRARRGGSAMHRAAPQKPYYASPTSGSSTGGKVWLPVTGVITLPTGDGGLQDFHRVPMRDVRSGKQHIKDQNRRTRKLTRGPSKPRRRIGAKKFDKTLGYPGEGPRPNNPIQPGVREQNCAMIKHCHIRGHFHRGKPLTGGARRVAEEQEASYGRDEKKAPKLCEVEKASECTKLEPHYHNEHQRVEESPDANTTQQNTDEVRFDQTVYSIDTVHADEKGLVGARIGAHAEKDLRAIWERDLVKEISWEDFRALSERPNVDTKKFDKLVVEDLNDRVQTLTNSMPEELMHADFKEMESLGAPALLDSEEAYQAMLALPRDGNGQLLREEAQRLKDELVVSCTPEDLQTALTLFGATVPPFQEETEQDVTSDDEGEPVVFHIPRNDIEFADYKYGNHHVDANPIEAIREPIYALPQVEEEEDDEHDILLPLCPFRYPVRPIVAVLPPHDQDLPEGHRYVEPPMIPIPFGPDIDPMLRTHREFIYTQGEEKAFSDFVYNIFRYVMPGFEETTIVANDPRLIEATLPSTTRGIRMFFTKNPYFNEKIDSSVTALLVGEGYSRVVEVDVYSEIIERAMRDGSYYKAQGTDNDLKVDRSMFVRIKAYIETMMIDGQPGFHRWNRNLKVMNDTIRYLIINKVIESASANTVMPKLPLKPFFQRWVAIRSTQNIAARRGWGRPRV